MKNQKKPLVLSFLVLAVMFTALVSFKPQSQNEDQQQEDPPTPVQPGVMTEKQRKHSKRYSKAKLNGTLIPDPTNMEPGETEHLLTYHLDYVLPKKVGLPTQSEYFKALSCGADLIVVARVTKKDSQLSENFKAMFTDYELEIERVLKNNSNVDFQTSNEITLNVPGGSIIVGDRVIKYKIMNQYPIRKGREYLLFLDYKSDSEDYQLSHDRGIFSISDNKIKTPKRQYVESTDNVDEIINLVTGASTNCSAGEVN